MDSTGAYVEGHLTCPYDSSHVILRHRFITHLVRCRRNHPNSPSAVCGFNQSHIVPFPELRHHMDNCPDREQTDRFINALESRQPIEVNIRSTRICEDEDWEVNAPCYDPSEYCANNLILRRLDIAPRAVRRVWHEGERLRFQQLGSTQPPQVNPRRMPHPIAPPATISSPMDVPESISNLREMTIASDAAWDSAATGGPPPGEPRMTDHPWQNVPSMGRGRGRML